MNFHYATSAQFEQSLQMIASMEEERISELFGNRA